ncbi:putative uncharacterized protein [Prevotella sp. CAG:873]|nr:putative uncharacterized protein [Prevotella sp. CAG:873]HRN04662.1 hypothetical protein [Muribaculaceae bacterium]
MAQIIPLNHLAEILAIRIGISDVEAQRFIQQYFGTISYGLISGGEVSIKGLGTFARSSNADLAVTFTPDESLAKILNAPFEAFVPVPIPGDIEIQSDKHKVNDAQEALDSQDLLQKEQCTEANLAEDVFTDNSQELPSTSANIRDTGVDKSSDKKGHTNKTQAAATQEHPTSEQESNTGEQPISGCTDPGIDSYTAEVDSDLSDSDIHTETDDTDVVDAADDETIDEAENAEVYILPRHRCRSMLCCVLGLLVGVLTGIVIGYYFHNDIDRYIGEKPDVVAPKSDVIKPKPKANVPVTDARIDSCTSDKSKVDIEKTISEPRFDVITSHQFLTTLAKKYYGVKDYWVYIYEANKTRLRHPDRIKPGTRVMIPEITEFLDDPTPTTTNLRQARQLAIQIYGRFE